jgi:predicted dehydrogenase
LDWTAVRYYHTLELSLYFSLISSYSMRHLSVGHAKPLRAELQAFVAAIREGREPAVTGEEGVASLEIGVRCLERHGDPECEPPPTFTQPETQASRCRPRRESF